MNVDEIHGRGAQQQRAYPLDVGATLSDDVLVELLVDVHLCHVVVGDLRRRDIGNIDQPERSTIYTQLQRETSQRPTTAVIIVRITRI